MKTIIAFWTGVVAVVSSLLFWRNSKLYPRRSLEFKIMKTIVEMMIIFLSVWKLPALLGAWIGFWLTKPIENPKIKITVGVIVGTIIGLAGGYFIELILILGCLAIDSITGEKDGFLLDWKKAKWNDFERSQKRA